MSKSIQNMEALAMLLVAGGALFVGYKLYKGGRAVADFAGDALDSAAQAVDNTVTAIQRGAQNAYAEVATIVTGQQHYSPEALDASMSKADAIALADDIARAQKVFDDEQYQLMADMENQRLLSRYPASVTSDPSLPYFGYPSP